MTRRKAGFLITHIRDWTGTLGLFRRTGRGWKIPVRRILHPGRRQQALYREVLLADNDCIHGGQLIQGSIALAAGRHPIPVFNFENKFGEMLKVGYEGPGIGRQEIPDSVLTH